MVQFFSSAPPFVPPFQTDAPDARAADRDELTGDLERNEETRPGEIQIPDRAANELGPSEFALVLSLSFGKQFVCVCVCV